MANIKFDFNKCNKSVKKIYDNQICWNKCVWSNNCSVNNKICDALIKKS